MNDAAATTEVRTVDVFKTARFSMVPPSGRKRAALNYAMRQSHICFGRLLDEYMPDEDDIEHLRSLTAKERRQELNALQGRLVRAVTPWKQLGLASKASIAREAVANISSHIELKSVQEHAGIPSVPELRVVAPEHDKALLALKDAVELETENALRDELLRRARSGRMRPLYFSVVRRGDGFLLLRNDNTSRICAWLNLFPADSRFAKPVTVSNMTNLQTGEIVSFTSRTGMLFPLEMGHAYHLKTFIDRDDSQRPTPQSARLIYLPEEDRYELHVAFQWKSVAIETRRWLGVDRGIYNLAALAVVDGDGRVLSQKNIDGLELRERQRGRERAIAEGQRLGRVLRDKKRKRWADHAVHNAANEIVSFALEHKAQVVIEDLSSFSAIGKRPRVIGRRRGGFNKLLTRKQYEKIANVLNYKLRAVGLPDTQKVRAAGTSQTCPECAHWCPDNRKKTVADDGFDMAEFKCVSCGHTADADLNAARNIALKGAWLRSLPKKPQRGSDGRLAEAFQLETYLREAADRRWAT